MASELKYYRESNGDYVSVDASKETKAYYARIGKPDWREARATCIAGLVDSVCTTSVSQGFLNQKCRRVKLEEVPQEWREVLD